MFLWNYFFWYCYWSVKVKNVKLWKVRLRKITKVQSIPYNNLSPKLTIHPSINPPPSWTANHLSKPIKEGTGIIYLKTLIWLYMWTIWYIQEEHSIQGWDKSQLACIIFKFTLDILSWRTTQLIWNILILFGRINNV